MWDLAGFAAWQTTTRVWTPSATRRRRGGRPPKPARRSGAQGEADRWARLSRLANQHETTRREAAFLKRLRAEVGPAVGGAPTLRNWLELARNAINAYDPVTWDMQVMEPVDRPPRTRSLLDPPDDGSMMRRSMMRTTRERRAQIVVRRGGGLTTAVGRIRTATW